MILTVGHFLAKVQKSIQTLLNILTSQNNLNQNRQPSVLGKGYLILSLLLTDLLVTINKTGQVIDYVVSLYRSKTL